MGTEKNIYNLEDIPANRKLVEKLYAYGEITSEVREYALNLLYPHDKWGLWISHILTFTGLALILSGIIFFFAYNWDNITPIEKLLSIEISIIACLMFVRSPKKLRSKILLPSASILLGVFLAVFGQTYQTGADAYQLFRLSLLTFGWIFIANFSAGRIFWLTITNIFLFLWWNQEVVPTREMESMIFVYMSLINGAALALREYFTVKKGYPWFKGQWTRLILTLAIMPTILIPILLLLNRCRIYD